MTTEKLLDIINKEKLIIPLLNIKPSNESNSFGYYKDDNNKWNIYETDDRAVIYRICIKENEEDAIDELLTWLRDKKYIDSLTL